MGVTYTTVGRRMTITLTGEVDHHGAKEMMDSLSHQIDIGMPNSLILSLKGVTFMDSSGIALLLCAKRQMDSLSGTCQVVEVPAQARRVLEAAQIERWVDIQYLT